MKWLKGIDLGKNNNLQNITQKTKVDQHCTLQPVVISNGPER